VKLFVIFVSFVVTKYYPKIEEKIGEKITLPVEYRLDQDRVVHPKRYSTGQRAPRKEKKNSKHEIRNTKQIQMT
jgi:hypothetical protein